MPIVAGLNPEFGLVVSGHTHRFYSCTLPNSGGHSVVTSAGTNGQLITDIDYTLDRRTGRFAEITRAERDRRERRPQPRRHLAARTPPASSCKNPDLVDPDAKVIADKYRAAVAPIANRVVGSDHRRHHPRPPAPTARARWVT